jgi:hypothetical protein
MLVPSLLRSSNTTWSMSVTYQNRRCGWHWENMLAFSGSCCRRRHGYKQKKRDLNFVWHALGSEIWNSAGGQSLCSRHFYIIQNVHIFLYRLLAFVSVGIHAAHNKPYLLYFRWIHTSVKANLRYGRPNFREPLDDDDDSFMMDDDACKNDQC